MSLRSSRISLKEMGFMLYGKFLDILPQGAPTEPTDQVKELIANVGLSQGEISRIYQVFLRLRVRDGNKRLANQPILTSTATVHILGTSKEQVEILLKNVLQLGGCYEHIDWDHFLFVFIKLCSLSKVEICQLLFLIIVRELRGLEVHYLTSTQLDRFYERYRTEGTPASMNCSKIHFSNFPLARYYTTDFIEVCFLYSPLLNPILILQRQFQKVIPSVRFWDSYDYLSGTNRKIGLDFFLIKRITVKMTERMSVQETCDLLLLSSKLVHEKLVESRQKREEVGQDRSGKFDRWMEIDFLSRGRKMEDREIFRIERVDRKLPTEGIVRKNADIGKPV
jgi:hypothetical protein